MTSENPTMAQLTTLHVGGPVGRYEITDSNDALAEAVAEADRAGTPVLAIGGGSNILAGDEGFPGLVVRDGRSAITEVEVSACGGATVRVAAGTAWDDFVAHAVGQEWMGVEALSGIPGTVGAAPVQNIGAYGQEVAETLASVRVLDRLTGQQATMALMDLRLAYRQSIIKRSLVDQGAGGGRTWGPTGRWVILEVEFQLRRASLSAPVRYGELARTLGIEVGTRAPSRAVRQAVLELRRGKGMVVDPSDHDTWSAGSFFTNPILSEEEAAQLPQDAPRFPVEDRSLVASIASIAPVVPGKVKTSAAWLISHAGFEKGFRVSPEAPAALSSKHALALTNRGGARAEDLLQLAREVRQGVADRFGIILEPEPVTVGCAL